MVESDWIEYRNKSGQPIFLCNKVTGVHKWPPGYNDQLSTNRIIYAKQVKHCKTQGITTQTDDNGCNNGCTSMDINTDPVHETLPQPQSNVIVDCQYDLKREHNKESNFDKKQEEKEENLVCEDNGEDEWIKYMCESGQVIFHYNKVTGVHKWPPGYYDCSSEGNIIHGQPVPIIELCNITTQTDDPDRNNGCTCVCVKLHQHHMSEVAPRPQSLYSNSHLDNEYKLDNNDSGDYQQDTYSTMDYREKSEEIPNENDTMLKVQEERKFASVAVEDSKVCTHRTENSNDDTTPDIDESSSQNIESRGTTTQQIKTEDRGKPFGCNNCQKTFKRKESLKEHFRTHTKEKPYECSHCGKKFASYKGWKVHLRTHTKEKPYECSYCKKKFTVSVHLKVHLRTHTKERPFECSFCKKTFTQSCSLKSHLRTHTNERPYECSYCKKTFSQSATLKNHLRTHTKEKPYECPHCDNRFIQISQFKRHIRTHTNEKPFQCSCCSEKFARSDTLKDHLKIHTNEKPFECSYCKKTFRQRSHFRGHVRTHTNEKPFECTNCGKTFSRSDVMKSHLRTHTKMKNPKLNQASCSEKHQC